MWGRKQDELAEVKELLREQNSLLRELLFALGVNSRTPVRRQLPQGYQVKTDKDVLRSTPEERATTERTQAAAVAAPWRGPASPASDGNARPAAKASAPPSIASPEPTPLL